MMHQFAERIAPKSALFYLGDGKWRSNRAKRCSPPIPASIF